MCIESAIAEKETEESGRELRETLANKIKDEHVGTGKEERN